MIRPFILFVHPFEKNRDEVLGDLPAVVLFVTRHPDDLLADDVAEEHGAESENGVTRLHFAKSTFAYSPGDVIESRLFHAKLALSGNLGGLVTVESAVKDQPGDRRILFEARQQAERERFEEASIVALRIAPFGRVRRHDCVRPSGRTSRGRVRACS